MRVTFPVRITIDCESEEAGRRLLVQVLSIEANFQNFRLMKPGELSYLHLESAVGRGVELPAKETA